MTKNATDKLADLAEDYKKWAGEREVISAKEASGNFPHPDEWAGSDDLAVELLEAIARRLGWEAK